jgi:hypothetical protein
MRGIEERWTTLRLGSVELVEEMHDAVIGGEKIGAWSRTLPHIMHANYITATSLRAFLIPYNMTP